MHRLRVSAAFLALALFAPAAWCDAAPQSFQGPEMNGATRMDIIRLLTAEFAFARVGFPRGEKGLEMKPDGTLSPAPVQLRQLIATYGPAARPGDRVKITNVEIKDKTILLEINGGNKKKKKWYQHIEVSGMGGTAPVGGTPYENVVGSVIKVDFNKHVPEISLADLKEILKPIFDFGVKSAAQAYAETLPKNVQDAIKDHRVLVGMNQEMVTYSKGRPPQRVREKDDTGQDYEEWIYGTPPEEVTFVRFNGDEVRQVKTMTVDGHKIVNTRKEVFLEPEPGSETAQAPKPSAEPVAPGAGVRPAGAPTLRRPGEAPVEQQQQVGGPNGPVAIPGPPQAPPQEPGDGPHR
jgi:hypothetical protein